MRCRILPCVLLLLTFCLPALPAFADTRYVVDELIITMRLGKGTGYKILKSLKTGTAVEVLVRRVREALGGVIVAGDGDEHLANVLR